MHQAAQFYIFERLALLPQVVQLLGDILLDVSVPAGRDFYNFCMILTNMCGFCQIVLDLAAFQNIVRFCFILRGLGWRCKILEHFI